MYGYQEGHEATFLGVNYDRKSSRASSLSVEVFKKADGIEIESANLRQAVVEKIMSACEVIDLSNLYAEDYASFTTIQVHRAANHIATTTRRGQGNTIWHNPRTTPPDNFYQIETVGYSAVPKGYLIVGYRGSDFDVGLVALNNDDRYSLIENSFGLEAITGLTAWQSYYRVIKLPDDHESMIGDTITNHGPPAHQINIA